MAAIPTAGEIQRRVLDLLVDGIGLYAGEKLTSFAKEALYGTLEVHLKQYTKGTLKIGLSMLDLLLPQLKTIPYVGDWLHLWGKDGVKDIATQVIDKPAYCVATDVNTIRCYNFDTTNVVVKIDGASVTISVSGTAEDMTISLAAPMAAGKHDVLVAGNKVAWYGKVVV